MEEEFKIVIVLIGIVYSDDYLHPKEFDWLENMIKSKDFTEAQYNILLSELSNPSKDHLQSFSQIANYFTRSRIIDFARYAFNIDGDYSQSEKKAYHYLRDIHEKLSKDINDEAPQAALSVLHNVEQKIFYNELDQLGKSLSMKPKHPFTTLGLSLNNLFTTIFSRNKLTLKLGVIFFLILIIFVVVNYYFIYFD
jgi:hypothetical protein